MSDTGRAPDWQASDGNWYPAEQRSPTPPPAAPYAMPAQPTWAQQPPEPAPRSAIVALVLSIVSWVFCPVVAAIAALVVAHSASKKIKASPGRDGAGLVTASRVIAIVHLGLAVPIFFILSAIAVPTFAGAKDRAQAREAQSELRNAITAARVAFTDQGAMPTDVEVLTAIEPSIAFEAGDGTMVEGIVDVELYEGAIAFGTLGKNGTCYYVIGDGLGDTAFAESKSCGWASDQNWLTSW